MKGKATFAALAFLVGAFAASQANAQAKPEDLVKQRKAGMTMIGKYFGPIGAMVQGKIPYDAKVIERNAGYLEVLAKLPWDGFHASTKDFADTRAKPEIFSEMDKFKNSAEEMQDAMGKLVAAARSGSQDAVKSAFGATGKTCKGCHDDYRKEK